MALQNAELSELQLLAKHEETIGLLYEAYAKRFPEHAQFWTSIANDEKSHAAWIWKLCQKAEDGSIRFDGNRFNSKAIETSLKYIRSWIQEAETQSMDLIKAISIALDIENGLLEKKYYEVFEADLPEVKQVFIALSKASEGHKQRIAAFLADEKRKG